MKEKAVVWAYYSEWEKKFSYAVNQNQDMQSCGWTKVKDIEVEFTEPAYADLVKGTIAGLELKRQKIQADAFVECNAIQETINNLLCIENKVEVVVEE